MTDDLSNAVSGLRFNLDKLRQSRLSETRAITQLGEELLLVQDSLRPSGLLPISPAYNSLLTFVTTYNASITGQIQESKRAELIVATGASILTGMASYLSEARPEAAAPLVKRIEVLREARNVREGVYAELEKHSTLVAKTFLSAWQVLEAPAIDPARGPAFLMREAITQFFHYFAPDDMVKSKTWYKPHDERKDVTRADRIRYIMEERIIPSQRSPLVELQLEGLKRLYGNLNRAHEQRQLDSNTIKSLLYETQDLLGSILRVIG